MKKYICLFLILLTLPLAACGAKVDLMPGASPETSALALYVYDGETITRQFLFDTEAEKTVLQDFHNAKASPMDLDVTALEPPFYGLEIGGTDGFEVHGLWSGGYFILDDGTAYKFDYDFPSLLERCDWREPDRFSSLSVMPCASHVAKTEAGWNSKFLTPAGDLGEAVPGVSMEIAERSDDSILVRYTNNSGGEWEYGLYYGLQVQLDGQWYEVPAEEPVAVPDIAMVIPDGMSIEESYRLVPYGDLPAGTYRLAAEHMAVEFEP